MSKITLLLFVVALTMCVMIQTAMGAPPLHENEEGNMARCSNQGAHCKSNSDCCFYLKCDSYSKLCWP
ncbi:hypothetical protein KPH14_003761 [Odynerus spinipes]|uniref:Uncharacterized protein n=1 Tax=Odynerus spinipes TaxID=1348599 RepID=A0AAD9RXZ9_9HYME|nr:hypothetical protein KPH14_003761 [Odynerus spinipes]